MSRFRARFDAARRSGDSGIAIVAAMAVVMLVGIMLTVVVGIAISEATQSGRDRQRASAVSVAEGSVDVITAQIQSSAPADLEALCGPVTAATDVGADDFGLTTTITYYDTAGTEVPCASVATTQVAQARIVTRAKADTLNGTTQAKRAVETLVELSPTFAAGLDKALFSQADMTISNNAVLTSASGKPDADIYTNEDFYCRNNQEFHGSIHAQGSINLDAQCTVFVDAWAQGQVKATNQSASIGGRALSSASSISLGKTPVGQQARAKLTVTGDICATAGKCFSNQTVDPPPELDFPHFVWDATAEAAWAAAGYTNVVTLPTAEYPCGGWSKPDGYNGKGDSAAVWMAKNGPTLPADTVLLVNCPESKVLLQGIDVVISKNLAVISQAGITMSGNTMIKSAPGTGTAADPNLLYLIQPYSADLWGTYSCSGDGISLDNQVTVDKTVNTLIYSPCPVRKANKSEIVGQVYSGSTMSIDNQLDMSYVPMPVPGGLTGAGSSTIESYSVDVLYKREAL